MPQWSLAPVVLAIRALRGVALIVAAVAPAGSTIPAKKVDDVAAGKR